MLNMSLTDTLTKFNLHEPNPDLFIQVKSILESKKSENIKNLYDYIKQVFEDKTKISTSVTDSCFDKKLTDNIHQFWSNYYTYFDNGNDNKFFIY